MAKFLHSNVFPSFLIENPCPYHRYVQFQEKARIQRKESILFLEHRPSLTGGVGAKAENLLSSPNDLRDKGIELILLPRGGDYTAHEPGQIVGYPHIDLKKREILLGNYLSALTFAIRNAIFEIWRVEVNEDKRKPGLYLKGNPNQKLVSLGVYAKSYFTSFGFALNGVNALDTFRHINPCGAKASDMINLATLSCVKDWKKERIRFIGAFLFHLDSFLS